MDSPTGDLHSTIGGYCKATVICALEGCYISTAEAPMERPVTSHIQCFTTGHPPENVSLHRRKQEWRRAEQRWAGGKTRGILLCFAFANQSGSKDEGRGYLHSIDTYIHIEVPY